MKNASLAAKLKKLSMEATDCRKVKTLSYGAEELWNIATCLIQNAEMEGNNLVGHVQSWLCDETDECQAFFRKLGFSF